MRLLAKILPLENFIGVDLSEVGYNFIAEARLEQSGYIVDTYADDDSIGLSSNGFCVLLGIS